MKRVSPFLVTILLGFTVLTFGSAALLAQESTVVEEIVARINDKIVTRADMRRARDQLLSEIHQQAPDTPATEVQQREKDLLRDLIDQQLMLQKGDELGINVEADVIKRLDELRKQMNADSMEQVEKAAQAQGISFEDFKQNLKNGIITQRVISQEVGGHINVSQQEIQQYYDTHKADMERPEQVRLSEILVSTQPAAPVTTDKGKPVLPETSGPEVIAQAQAKADGLYNKLKSGANFADLAKQYSEGPTAANGGDLEYFKRGTLSAELEQKVFALKPGQYTEPIRTNQGFVILEVTEHQDAGVPPLKEVQPKVQEQIYMTKLQPTLREYLMKLREDAYIDIKPGYVDTGASPNETKPVYTTVATEDTSKSKKKKKFGVF